MCLLVNQTASSVFSDEFLSGVYQRNKDGLGIMYADEGKLHIFKALPKKASEFVDFYRAHAEGRDCVWHARMQTHGDVDMDNCHPYMVTEDIWVAHNGILSAGNRNDQTRSDTWHFIKNVLRPALSHNPKLLDDKDFIEYMGDLIGGGNKLGFVRSDGRIVVINHELGIRYQEAWLSNTYAWDYNKLTGNIGGGHRYGGGSRLGNSFLYDEEDEGWALGGGRRSYHDGYQQIAAKDAQTTKTAMITAASGLLPKADPAPVRTYQRATPAQIKKYAKAAFNVWNRKGFRDLTDWVYTNPEKAGHLLAEWYDTDPLDMMDLPKDDPTEAADWIESLIKGGNLEHLYS